MITTALPDGLAWDATRTRLKVLRPDLADTVLRDPHIITGVARSAADMAKRMPAADEVPSITGFFELWYTVNDDYARFNRELRKVFTARSAAGYTQLFDDMASRYAERIPAAGDLVPAYFSPFLTHSTFAMIGVPPADWPNLAKVAKLVIHLFKQQLLGVTEHSAREMAAFETVMRYLKSLTDRLLAGEGDDSPFLDTARELSTVDDNSWSIAALIGQLLMAGIEPMITACTVSTRDIWADPELLAMIRDDLVDTGEITEEVVRQHPPFGNIFRFVAEPCDCLGVRLEPGTIIAIDTAEVNLAQLPAETPVRGCPVRPAAVLTFGKGTHYCLGANSARLQVAAGIRCLAKKEPRVLVDPAAVRVDTHNNLKEVRALPYATEQADQSMPQLTNQDRA